MYNVSPPHIDWVMIMPVCIVITTGILALIMEMIWPRRTNDAIVLVCLAGLAYAAYLLVGQVGAEPQETFARMVLRDPAALAMQLLLVGVAFVCVMLSEGYLRQKRIPFGEFYPLILWSTAGGMLMVATKNLLMLFLGLEILSISLYVMAGMSRREARSEESAIKYFLLGAFASGFLLYGIAFFYGATGSLHLDVLTSVWPDAVPQTRVLVLFGLALLLIGLSFKSAFVPFHQWTPDVYQGAPTNVTAFMAAGSKIAAIGALYRVLEAFAPLRDQWIPALIWIAVATMTVGNLVACMQTDLKRTLGYSSIAHAGYLLVALLAHFRNPEQIGITTTVVYLLSYSLMTIGAFAVISMTAKGGKESTSFQALHGLYQRSPLATAALIIFMASLIGVPPTAGFVGKFMIFGDALNAGLTPLAIVLAINSVISVYYYVGIIKAAFVSEEGAAQAESAPVHPGLAGAFMICAVGTVGITLFFTPLMRWMGLQ